MKPSLDIIIVNWNSGDQLRAALRSIAGARSPEFELRRIVVVDNASRDGSTDGLDGTEPSVVVLRNETNRGFGAACNQGARGSCADYLLFLNPDTRLFADSLSVPLRFMESPEADGVGICGIALIDEAGQVARSCSRFPTTSMFMTKMLGLEGVLPTAWARQRMTDWDHGTSRSVDQVIGAFFLMRRGLFERLEGFDERFFVYFEEVDLSLRAARLGARSYFLADARAVHRGNGCTSQIPARRLTYSLRSRLEYGLKHYSGSSAVVLVLGSLLVEPASRVAMSLARGSLRGAAETLRGYAAVWRDGLQFLHRAARQPREPGPRSERA